MVKNNQNNEAENLENLYVEFVETVLSIMNSRISTEGLPRYCCPGVFFTNRGYFHGIDRITTFLALLEPDFDQKILQMEVTERCAKRHLEEGILTPPEVYDRTGNLILNPPFREIKKFLVGKLLEPAIDILLKYATFKPTKEQILERYRYFKDKWSVSNIRYCWVPLQNFECDLHKVHISDIIELTLFTPEEKTEIWNIMSPTLEEMMGLPEYREARYKLVGSYIKNQTYALNTQMLDLQTLDPLHFKVKPEIECILTSLRLLKRGDVGASIILEKPTSTTPWGQSSTTTMSLNDYRVRPGGNIYKLSESELPNVLKIFNILQKEYNMRERSSLGLALRRFNQAYSSNTEDRIINLVIALESTLLSGITEELSYRLSLRGAALLKEKRKPEWTKCLLKIIYDIRSEIIHGDKRLHEAINKKKNSICKIGLKPDPYQFTLTCEDVLRDILTEYLILLSRDKSLSDINEELDKCIVKSLRK